MNGSKPTVTEQVQKLYDDIGWTMVGDVTFDAHTAEDLRHSSAAYLTSCRKRVAAELPPSGDRLLDMASGPIQYREYLDYSAGYTTRVCVDLSQRALDMAKAKIGPHGEYHCGDFLDLDIAPVAAAVSLHTLYHIDQARQEAAVQKLIDVTRPGGTIVIVYSNPNNLVSLMLRPIRLIQRLFVRSADNTPEMIYFRPFSLSWWRRFENRCEVSIKPWRTLSTPVQRRLVPGGATGERLLAGLFRLEDRYPRFFAAVGVYPMIVMRRR